MRLGPHRPFLSDFQIEQELVAVIVLAEAAKRRPHQVAFVGRRPKIAVENELAVFFADPKLVAIGIENLDAVLRAFGERRAMPSVFLRAVGARFGLACPTRHFELGLSRLEVGIYQPEFDFMHRAIRGKLPGYIRNECPSAQAHNPGAWARVPSAGGIAVALNCADWSPGL